MPKKSTGYTPNKSKSNPTDKQAVPMKNLSVKTPSLVGPNNIASVPSSRFPKLTRPPKISAKPPRI